MRASFMLRNNAPNSASAALAATKGRIVQRLWKAPLSRIGSSSFGREPRKKYPEARLRPFVTDKYEASEWTFSIMSEA